MCQWRRLKSVFQFLQVVFIAVFDTHIQQHTCTPHMYRLVLPVAETPSEKAMLGLRPTLARRTLTRISWPLHLPALLPHGWVIAETAEGQQNQHVRKGS